MLRAAIAHEGVPREKEPINVSLLEGLTPPHAYPRPETVRGRRSITDSRYDRANGYTERVLLAGLPWGRPTLLPRADRAGAPPVHTDGQEGKLEVYRRGSTKELRDP